MSLQLFAMIQDLKKVVKTLTERVNLLEKGRSAQESQVGSPGSGQKAPLGLKKAG